VREVSCIYGFVCKHKPAEAVTQLAALDLGRRAPKPAGERPSARLARAPPAPPPLPPPSPPPPTPTPSQPQMASEDGAEEVRAATAEVIQEAGEEDSADAVLITDNESSLVDAGGILSWEEVNKTSTLSVPYPAVERTTSSANPLAQACAVIIQRSAPTP
jgi:hypothetical protein